jgi:lipopolysaccharide/colanic/teichoic acid biosynthesis glycosyltransferase
LRYRRCKRAMDVVLAAAGLFFLFPLLTLIAVAIRLESRGPVLFRQLRGGENGRPFRIYKFRTMNVVEDGPEVRQATEGDDRITRVGHFLRMSSLDELPQLVNVIAGHMSLVGPRPHAIAHDVHYGQLIENYATRYSVRPGLTGLAQASGLRGETATLSEMRQRVEADNLYVEQQSLQLDIAIIVRTLIGSGWKAREGHWRRRDPSSRLPNRGALSAADLVAVVRNWDPLRQARAMIESDNPRPASFDFYLRKPKP